MPVYRIDFRSGPSRYSYYCRSNSELEAARSLSRWADLHGRELRSLQQWQALKPEEVPRALAGADAVILERGSLRDTLAHRGPGKPAAVPFALAMP